MSVAVRPPPPRFTEMDAARAYAEWGANCGPGAIAAIAGLTLDELRPYLFDFEAKGYTNPTLMWSVLRALTLSFTPVRPLTWPTYGLVRIQWEGPWTAPGVPPRVAYRHTHWIGAATTVCDEVGVFDINCMNSGGWVSLVDWSSTIVPHLIAGTKANGRWHLTHAVEVEHR